MSASRKEPYSDKPYLTVDEAAERLRVSRWKVYDLIRSRELASFRVGSRRRIPVSALDEMVNRLLKEVA